jgi:hypothetical protein
MPFDPITTLLAIPAVVGALATARPQYERCDEKYEKAPLVVRTDTEHALLERSLAATEILIQFSSPPTEYDKREQLKVLIFQFAALPAGWDGDGSLSPTIAAVDAAVAFLNSIPPGIPLPTPMVTSAGDMEFFWDISTGYADISFNSSGIGSFFAKDLDGKELFLVNTGSNFPDLPYQHRILSLLAPHLLTLAA